MFGSAPELLRSTLPDVAGSLVLDSGLPGLSGLDFQLELAKVDEAREVAIACLNYRSDRASNSLVIKSACESVNSNGGIGAERPEEKGILRDRKSTASGFFWTEESSTRTCQGKLRFAFFHAVGSMFDRQAVVAENGPRIKPVSRL